MYLKSSHSHSVLKCWQSDDNCNIQSDFLIYPIFICDKDDCCEEIKSLPEQYRVGINKLYDYLHPKFMLGLKSVLLFGSIDNSKKDKNGSLADSLESPVMKAIEFIKNTWKSMMVICDICLCSYTFDGACSISNENGEFLYDSTINRLVSISLSYAKQGCHMISPSDMTDCRISAIRSALNQNNFKNIPIMSYSAKFCSNLYGPFRNAVGNEVVSVQRPYQLPVGSKKLAMRALERDISEGADMLMIKPALSSLDIISSASNKFSNHVIAAYQVSGEYSMIYYGSKNNLFDLKNMVHETFTCIRRAGAKVIVSYFVPFYLENFKS